MNARHARGTTNGRTRQGALPPGDGLSPALGAELARCRLGHGGDAARQAEHGCGLGGRNAGTRLKKRGIVEIAAGEMVN